MLGTVQLGSFAWSNWRRRWALLLPYVVSFHLIYIVLLVFGNLVLLRRTCYAEWSAQAGHRPVVVTVWVHISTTEYAALARMHIRPLGDVASPEHDGFLLRSLSKRIFGCSTERGVSRIISEVHLTRRAVAVWVKLGSRKSVSFMRIEWDSRTFPSIDLIEVNASCWIVLVNIELFKVADPVRRIVVWNALANHAETSALSHVPRVVFLRVFRTSWGARDVLSRYVVKFSSCRTELFEILFELSKETIGELLFAVFLRFVPFFIII